MKSQSIHISYIYHYVLSLLCSGVAPPKTGLQWQQPFLELVLACMHAQTTTHEELLGPLKTQLSTFLAAFEKVYTSQEKEEEGEKCVHFGTCVDVCHSVCMCVNCCKFYCIL